MCRVFLTSNKVHISSFIGIKPNRWNRGDQKSELCHLLVILLWASHFTSSGFNFINQQQDAEEYLLGACYGQDSVLDVQDIAIKVGGGPEDVSLPPTIATVGLGDGDGRYVSPSSRSPIPACHSHLSSPLSPGTHDQGINCILPGPADFWRSVIHHLVYRLVSYKYPIQNKSYILLSLKYIPREQVCFISFHINIRAWPCEFI